MGRLDRYGEPIELEVEDLPTHDPRCADGFLGEDEVGRLIPCLVCRPHLIGRRRSTACQTKRRQSDG